MAEDPNEKMEVWLERASASDLGEEDYQKLFEDLPADPELRKEWMDQLRVSLALEVVSEGRDVDWVREVLSQVPKKRVVSVPFMLKSLVALAILSVGLMVVVNSGVLRKDMETPSVPSVSMQEKKAIEKHGEERFQKKVEALDVREDVPVDALEFAEPNMAALMKDTEESMAKVEDDPVLSGLKLSRSGVSRSDVAMLGGDVVMDVDEIVEENKAVLENRNNSLSVPIGTLAHDPFGMEKKIKKRRMVAQVAPEFSNRDPGLREKLAKEDLKSNGRSFTEAEVLKTSSLPVIVGTSSYPLLRNDLYQNKLPQKKDVRIEEMINHFDYDYAPPNRGEPFSVHMEMAKSSWNAEHHLLRIGLKAKVDGERPPANLVFLVDVSQSMAVSNQWEAVKEAIMNLMGALTSKDRVSLITFGVKNENIFEALTGQDTRKVEAALGKIRLGGQEKGDDSSLERAYGVAAKHKMQKGINRVVVITDGQGALKVPGGSKGQSFLSQQLEQGLGISVLNLGTGSSQKAFLQNLARLGGGSYFDSVSLVLARKALASTLGTESMDVAEDVKARVSFNPDVVASYRLVGFEGPEQIRKPNGKSKDFKRGISMGHEMTALYEVIPKKGAEVGARACSVQLSYKVPGTDKEDLMTRSLEWDDRSQKSADFQWAEVVAMWGRKLQNHPSMKEVYLTYLLDLGRESIGIDPYGERGEMLLLIQTWDELRQGKDPKQLPMLQFKEGSSP